MPSHEPDSLSPSESGDRLKKKRRLWLGLLVGSLVLVGGGISVAQYLIFQRLSPLVQDELSDTLNRPLKLGAVQGFSLGGINLGVSELPATDTANDRLLVQSVQVNYNLWQLLTEKKLYLNLTLNNPQVYLEQDRDQRWLVLNLDKPDPNSDGIKVDIGTIKLKNASLHVNARAKESGTLKTPIFLTVPFGELELTDGDKILNFDVEGDLTRGGSLAAVGAANLDTGAVDFELRGKKMLMSTVTDLLPLPFTLTDGVVDGAIQMSLNEDGDIENWEGEVIAQGVGLSLPQLAKPIRNANSVIRFEEQKLILPNLSGSLGALNLAGELIVDTNDAIEGNLVSEPVDISGILDTFEIGAPQFALEGKLRAAVNFSGSLEDPTLLVNAINEDPIKVDRIFMERFEGILTIAGNKFFIENFIAEPVLGGQFQGRGLVQMPTEDIPTGAIAVATRGTQLPTDALAKLYEIGVPIPLGQGRADLFFEAPLDQPDKFVVTGTAVVPAAGGTITATDLRVTLDRWQTPARAEGLRMARLTNQPLPDFLRNSLVNGDFVATGAFEKENGSPFEVTGEARSLFAGGIGIARKIEANADTNIWRAEVSLADLALKALAPQLPYVEADYDGNFVAAGILDNVSPETVEIVGSGQLTMANGNGRIRTENVTVAQGDWYSKAEVENLNLVSFAPQLGQFVSNVPTQGSFEVRGNLDTLGDLETVLAKGTAIATLAGGKVSAQSISLQGGELNSQLDFTGVALQPFSEQLGGFANGDVRVIANVLEPDLQNLKAQGDVRLSEGVSLIQSPLRSSLAWTGKRLIIREAIATNFAADGYLDINTDKLGNNPLAAITDLGLNLNAEDLDLAALPLPANAQALNLGGLGSFRGTVQGTPQQPKIHGQLRLTDAQVATLDLDAQLEGQIQTRGDRRLIVTLEGESDQILARLNPNLRPEQASLKLDDTSLDVAVDYGTSGLEPRQLRLQSNNFPVALIQDLAKGQPALQQLDLPIDTLEAGGRLSSDITADFPSQSASGRVAIADPSIGFINGDRLQGDFYYGNNTLMLRDFQWQRNASIYTMNTTVQLPEEEGQTPAIALTGNIEQGRIEDILVAMQVFDFTDIANVSQLTAADYLGRSSLFDDTQDFYDALPIASPEGTVETVVSQAIPPNPELFPAKASAATFSCLNLLNDSEQGENPTGDRRPPLFSRQGETFSFVERLALLSCVESQLSEIEMAAVERSFLPAKLADLQGNVNGKLSLNYNGADDITAEFDLRGGYQQTTEFGETVTIGEPWRWGALEIPYLITRGVFRNGVLTLRPVNIQLPEGQISFIGSFGGETQNGQLRLQEVPLAFVQKFIELPDAVGLQGSINASANLTGTAENPSARGNLTMLETRINDAEIAAVNGDFTYEKSRLNFQVKGELLEDTAPLEVIGSIPYQLPNATVEPENNDLTLDFNLQDEGFVLLNILSRGELAWIEGEGTMDLEIRGEINPDTGRPQDLVANGQVAIAQAEIQAKTLPDAPLTNVHGNITFNFNNLTVEELTGDFSGGNVTLAGTLPIVRPNPDESIQVDLTDLNFSLPDLYQGGVNGTLAIAGTAFEPKIGGDIRLEEGRVLLTDNQAETNLNPTSNPGNPPPIQTKANDPKQSNNPTNNSPLLAQATPPKPIAPDLRALTQFNNLKITLGRNIQITRNPILNFLATGDLVLNGTLKDPKPIGVIRLQRGQVNLFATQFRLDNGYNNTATFTRNSGLDPELDVVLQTSLIETSPALNDATDPLSAEVQDDSVFRASQLGNVETIRVQAIVDGKASELNTSVELVSSPPRSENQLIALLGGSLLDSFSDGDTDGTLALANLAGSALLNSIQDTIGNALGLSSLRLFPTVITDEKNRNSTLGLGAELSVDITQDISLSVLQILNSNEDTQFGLRYRVNDKTFVRGSTNLQDDSRLTIEYDLKF